MKWRVFLLSAALCLSLFIFQAGTANASSTFPCTMTTQMTDRLWFQKMKEGWIGTSGTLRDSTMQNQKFILFYNGGTAVYQIILTDQQGVLTLDVPTSGNATLKVKGNYYNGIYNSSGSSLTLSSYTANASSFDITGISSVCGVYNVDLAYTGTSSTIRIVRDYFPYAGDVKLPTGIKFADADGNPPSSGSGSPLAVTISGTPTVTANAGTGTFSVHETTPTSGGGVTYDQIHTLIHDYGVQAAAVTLSFAIAWIIIKQFWFRGR